MKHTTRARRLSLAVIAIMALVAGSLFSAGSASAASIPIRTGAHRTIDGRTFGVYLQKIGSKTRPVICIKPLGGLNHGQKYHVVTGLDGQSTAAKAILRFLLNEHLSHIPGQAEAVAAYSAVNYEVLNHKSKEFKVFYAAYKHSGKANIALTQKYLRDATHLHGPYTGKLSISGSPYVGHTVTATETISPGVSGKTVTFHASSGIIGAKAVTNSHGQASVHFTPTAISTTIAASAQGLASNYMYVSEPHPACTTKNPSKCQQTLLTSGTPTTLKSSTRFIGKVTTPSYRYTCPADCTQSPTDTFTATAPASPFESQALEYDNGHLAKALTYAPSTKSVTKSARGTTTDGHTITFGWRYKVHGKWTNLIVAGRATVHCFIPGSPTARLSSCCTKIGSVIIDEPTNVSGTTETLVWYVNGGSAQTHQVAPGASFTVNVPFNLNKTAKISVIYFNTVRQTASTGGAVTHGIYAELTAPVSLP